VPNLFLFVVTLISQKAVLGRQIGKWSLPDITGFASIHRLIRMSVRRNTCQAQVPGGNQRVILTSGEAIMWKCLRCGQYYVPGHLDCLCQTRPRLQRPLTVLVSTSMEQLKAGAQPAVDKSAHATALAPVVAQLTEVPWVA
jgi:hypothetical protein